MKIRHNHQITFIPIVGIFLFIAAAFFRSFNPVANAVTSQRTITNIGIFVKFSDSDTIVPKHNDGTPIHLDDNQSIENANRLLNSDSPIETELYANGNSIGKANVPSVKKYYETQSYGKLSIKTELFPRSNQKIISYQDQHPISYYLPKTDQNPSGYDDSNRSSREAELVNNAINAVSAQIENSNLDASLLDSNNDGKIDTVTLFIEGTDTQKIFVPQNSLLWSHVKGNSGDITAKIFNKEIFTHCIIYGPAYTEKTGTFSLENSGYGTIIHELGHTLGFSDLYRANGIGKPVGYYDVMGITTSSNPQNFLAYFTSEYQSGDNWHNSLPTIDKTTKGITVTKPNFTDPSEKRAVKVQKSSKDREYFIIEYYQPHDTRDGYSGKSTGIIIYRVNLDNRATGNHNNDASGKSDHIFIFRPGEPQLGASTGDLDHSALNLTRPTIGKNLSDTKDFDNETIYYSDGTNSGLVVTVTAETDHSVTFDISFPEVLGDGTINNPFLISDTSTYFYLMQSDTTNKYYKLTGDLDFKDLEYPKIDFQGHLDGNNKTLNNISVTGAGVFDNIGDYSHSSSVKNLKINNLSISSNTGNSSLGGLASTIDNATITNVHLLSGNVTNIAASFNNLAATGGLAGNTSSSVKIDNCSSALSITSPQNAGGLIGLNQNSQILNSHASGKINGGTNAGAFIGVQYSSDGKYSNPTNSTYDNTINPNLPTFGSLYNSISNSFQTPPSDLLQSIRPKTDTNPGIPPTEADVLQQLGLTKKQQYLTGFKIGTKVNDLHQTISDLDKVQLIYFRDTNGHDTTSGEISTNMQFAIQIDTAIYTYTTVIKGDVNGDGKIYATDYVRVRNHIMGKTKLTGAYLEAADINNDNQIYATDYVKIRNHIMGKTQIEQK